MCYLLSKQQPGAKGLHFGTKQGYNVEGVII